VGDITAGITPRMRQISESEVVITNEMKDSNSRVRLAVVIDVVVLVTFFAVIGIMAVKIR
jgi:hypothetical protein